MQNFALATTRWVGSLQSIIVHTAIFASSFLAVLSGLVSFERMLLVLTTIVSLEAIYLAIFIQMSINQTNLELEGVELDIDEIQEDIDEIQHDVDEIQEDVEEMTEDEKAEDEAHKKEEITLGEIRAGLEKLIKDFERLQQKS